LVCTLFCALALERAELLKDAYFPCLDEDIFYHIICKIAQESPQISKRARTYPDRIRRYVLGRAGFDHEDSGWLELMISGFLVTIEEFSNEI